MRAKLLRLAEVTEADWARWDALAERAAEPNLALDPRFLAPDQGSRDDEYLFVVAEEAGKWFGLLRVFAMDVSPTVGIPAYGTWDPPLFGESHPLLDRVRGVDALTAIARGLRRLLRSGYLPLRGYPASGPLADALRALHSRPAINVTVVGTHAAAWADVSPDRLALPIGARVFPAQVDPEYRSTGTRRMLRRYARRLADAGGGPLTLHDVSDDPEAIDRFVAMQASGWKGDHERGGTAVALDPRTERAFRDKINAFRASGDLIVLELWAGVQRVYSTIVLIVRDVALPFLDAYQHEFGEFSAGALGRTAACAHLRHLPRLVSVNPGIYDYYDEAAKIYPDRREYMDVVIGIGLVPSLTVRLLARADDSPRARKTFIAASRTDRFAMRVVAAARRRLKPTK